MKRCTRGVPILETGLLPDWLVAIATSSDFVGEVLNDYRIGVPGERQ